MSRLSKTVTLILLSLLFLSGCSSVPVKQVDDRIQLWKTSSIDEIIEYWGLPSKQQQVNNKNYAEWLNKESEPGNAAVSINTGSFSRHSAIGIGLTLFELGGSDDICSRVITYLDSGEVLEISWKGSQNYCYELTPDKNEMIKSKALMQY